jgi:hypothetical protein
LSVSSVRLIGKTLLSLEEILSLFFKDQSSVLLLIDFFILESKIVFQLVDCLLLSLLHVLGLVNVLLNIVDVSPQILIAFANIVNLPAKSENLTLSIFNLLLGVSDFIVDLGSLIISILYSVFQRRYFSLMMNDNSLLST